VSARYPPGMNPISLPTSWLLLFVATPAVAGDLQLEVPAGLEVSLWAESPLFYNPTAMDVDAGGQLWVTEAVNYRKWGGRNPGLDHPGGDRVVVLADKDGDGVCETSTVFAQGPELVSPLGILVLGKGRVLVSCSPDILLYVDEDGDGKADRHETFLTGFGGPNHDHGVHSFVQGPDGDFYIAAGNAGPHLVTDKAGWSLRSGSIYVGGGEVLADNKPGLLSDDGQAWTGGIVMRVGKGGAGLNVLAHNFRNIYEVALDSFGNMFTSDNDDDGNRGCRTLWVMEGGNYGYFSADGTRYWRADRRPGQGTQSAHWHQEDPGVSPMGTINGAGGPTGVCVYEGELLKNWVDGAVLNADAGAGVVYAHSPKRNGAGYVLDEGWIVRSASGSEEESAQWFRPSDVCVGIDGSVFIADWYDPGVGGHAAGDRAAYGRILRITPQGYDGTSEPIDLATIDGSLAAFMSPAPSVRAMGASKLFEETAEHLAVISETLAETADVRLKSRLIFGLARMGTAGIVQVVPYLNSKDVDLRVAALRALRGSGMDGFELLASRCKDSSPAVRREAMVRLQAFGMEEGYLDAMLLLAQGYDGVDRDYLEAFGSAASGYEDEIFVLLMGELGDTPSRWTEAFAGLAWRLHPASAIAAFTARASDVTLTKAQRLQSTDALAFIKERSAAEAMATLALLSDGAVQERAVWWLRLRDSNDWREYKISSQVHSGDLASAELVWESGLMKSGTMEGSVDIRGAKRLWLVLEDNGNGNACDWGDWIEPTLMGEAGVTRLTDLAWVNAEAAWGTVHKNANATGGEMRVAGVPVKWGIGTHANSLIEFVMPSDIQTFEFLVGPDEGGTGTEGTNPTSIEFKVYVEREKDRTLIMAQQALVLDEAAEENLREAATRALAVDPEGGLMLIATARAQKLSPQLTAVASEAIFSNPDIVVRTLASEVFERPGGPQASLPPIAELLKLVGNPVRGREVFESEGALCSTCHTFDGLGRDLGPDLTAISTKYGRAEIYDAILNPSAGIAFGYESWLLNVDGQGYLNGFILADGADVVLKDSSGLRHVVAKEDIIARERQSISIMPQGVALGVGAQGMADLVAFLAEDRASEPVYGEPVVLFDGNGLDAWSSHLNAADAQLSDVWSVNGEGVLVCKGSPAGYIYTSEEFANFRLEFDWRFDPEKGAGNSGVLLRMTGEHKVWPRSVEAQLHSRNAGDIWNIDEVPILTDTARLKGRRTTKRAPCNEKPLGEWNHYSITLDRGNLTLMINGEVQNTARWFEEIAGRVCLQSEGSEIHFKDIVLHPIVGRQ
jgi:putative membrane-bound dehydrogenase-like protein